jgi:hypothetical protein
MVGISHRKRCLRMLAPAATCSRPAFRLVDPDVPQLEARTRGLRDRSDGVPLIARPAPEVKDDRRPTAQYLMRSPDHAPLKDVPSTSCVVVSKQRSHPLVRGEPQNALLIRKPSRQRRLSRTGQANRQEQRGSNNHVITIPSASAAERTDSTPATRQARLRVACCGAAASRRVAGMAGPTRKTGASALVRTRCPRLA